MPQVEDHSPGAEGHPPPAPASFQGSPPKGAIAGETPWRQSRMDRATSTQFQFSGELILKNFIGKYGKIRLRL